VLCNKTEGRENQEYKKSEEDDGELSEVARCSADRFEMRAAERAVTGHGDGWLRSDFIIATANTAELIMNGVSCGRSGDEAMIKEL